MKWSGTCTHCWVNYVIAVLLYYGIVVVLKCLVKNTVVVISVTDDSWKWIYLSRNEKFALRTNGDGVRTAKRSETSVRQLINESISHNVLYQRIVTVRIDLHRNKSIFQKIDLNRPSIVLVTITTVLFFPSPTSNSPVHPQQQLSRREKR
jgi:hypothetical protein